MIKIVKISTHVISTVIIIMVVIPLVLSLILQNSGVQTWIVGKATDYISQKIGSRISIGKIDIGKFYNIQLYDFFVESTMGRDTLLYTNKLTTRLSALHLATNDVALTFVRLEGGEFNLYSSDSVTNIKVIIDKISGAPKKENPTPFSMSIGDIEIENLTFRYEKKDAQAVNYGINYQDMEMQNVSMELNRFNLVGDSISAGVDHIAFREKGGLELNSLSLKELYLSSSIMNFKGGDVTIDSTSYLKFSEVKISYSDWNMGDFVNSVPIEADITESRISLGTVAKFTKEPRKWRSVIDFQGTFTGTVMSMQGRVKRAVVGESVLTNTDYYIYNIIDITKTIFDLSIENLYTRPNDIVAIISDFSTKGATKLPAIIVGTTPLNIKGMFLGQMRNFDAECKISMLDSKDGFMKANINLRSERNSILVDGSVISSNIKTQKILRNESLERLTANIYMKGRLENGNSDVTLKGKIDSLYFNNYNYHDIELNGALEKKAFIGFVGCIDPNLDFNFNGRVDFSGSAPAYNFNLDLRSSNLSAIGVNKRDSISVLSGRIMANGYGDNIDNLDATIVLDNLKYINHQDTTIAENEIRIEAFNNTDRKSIDVTSDYFDLSFKGVHSYSELFNYIKKSSSRFLPALMPNSEINKISVKEEIKSEGSADDYYVITLNVKKANNIANIFIPSLTLAEDSKLSFIFNPSADNFSLNVSSKYIFLDNYMIFNIVVDSKSVGDLVNFFARAEEVYLGNIFFPNFSLIGDVQNNVINADFGFSNSEDNTYALIKSKTTLQRPNGELQYKINLLPSTLNLYKDVWKSGGGEILIASKRISISDYSLVSTNQSLKVNGVVSGSTQDTLHVTLDNFSLKPLALFTSKIGFEVNGAISGEVVGSSLLNKESLYVDADLRFKDNVINGVVIPDGYFHTEWNDFSRKLNFTLESGGEKYIWGHVKTKEDYYEANVKIPEFNIALINPFLAGIAHNPVGTANVDVTLSNPKQYFEINGDVDIPSFDATIVPTNVRYNIAAHAVVKDNQYSLTKGVVKDKDGGTGELKAWLTNERYKKVKYYIGVKANKMLGINTTEAQNTNFYGKAYATGDITINGDRNNIVMNVDAVSSKRSTFVLPLGGRTLSEVSFIKFVSKDSTVNERRKMIQQREASKNPTSFSMKMRLTATPLLESEIVMDPLTGSSIKATGNGLLDIGIDPANELFTINGEYVIDKGTYRFILPNFIIVDKLFDIKSGSWIRWSGDPLNATLNVDAIYKLKTSLAPILNNGMTNRVGVDCVLALKGALTQPDITLGVDVPDAGPEEQSALRSVLNTQEAISTQLFFLLVSNSFYATTGGAASNSSIGITGATTTGIEFLTNQIKNIFSSDKFDFGVNYRPSSDVSSNEFEFDISAPIVNNKVYIDITGNYNFMDNANDVTSRGQTAWSGDVYLTWLLNNSGNLSLKGFTKTIDTFDMNQGLQDSGVGIYFKSDFDNFRDMKLRYKDYIKRRREERVLRKEKRLEKQNKKTKL